MSISIIKKLFPQTFPREFCAHHVTLRDDVTRLLALRLLWRRLPTHPPLRAAAGVS